MCKRVFKDQTKSNGDIPFYKIGTFGKKADAYIHNDLYREYKEKYNFPSKNEVLISCSGTVGNLVKFNGEDAYFQDSNIMWFSNNEQNVINDYLYHLLSTNDWGKQNSTTITRIYKSDLESEKISYPPIKIQSRISSILSSIDNLILKQNEKKRSIRVHIKEFKTKLFIELYNNNDVAKFKLSEIIQIKKAKRNANKVETGAFPVYDANNVIYNSTAYDHSEAYISILKDGAGVGRIKLMPPKSSTISTMDNIQVHEELDIVFIYYSLKELNIKKYIVGSTIPHLYFKDYSSEYLSIPNLKVQKTISKFLSQMDNLVDKRKVLSIIAFLYRPLITNFFSYISNLLIITLK